MPRIRMLLIRLLARLAQDTHIIERYFDFLLASAKRPFRDGDAAYTKMHYSHARTLRYAGIDEYARLLPIIEEAFRRLATAEIAAPPASELTMPFL